MGDGFAASMADIFDDLFGDMMGGARGGHGSGRERGADLRYNLEITLEEAFRGKTAHDQIADLGRLRGLLRARAPRRAPSRVTCSTCGGHGRVRAQQGFFAIERTCPTCQGRGQTIDNPCDNCAGAGRVTRERTLSVNIPAGVEDGTRIRLDRRRRGGHARRPGGRSLHLPVASSRTRSSSATAPTSIAGCRSRWCRRRSAASSRSARSTAATPRSAIPEGTQSGRQFKLRGKGMPVLRSRDVGDLYHPGQCRDAAEPDQDASASCWRSSTPESSNKTHPESAGFFAKMKEFFEGLG